MVERRHEHLDVVGLHDPDAVEQVLLGQPLPACRARRRAAGQLVDELVDAGRADAPAAAPASACLRVSFIRRRG